jgi:hypothetical protein
VLCLDSTRLLTRGSPVGPTALLDHLHPTRGVYTEVTPSCDGYPPLIGQMHYHMGQRSAHLSFIMPVSASSSPGLIALLERLAWQAGEWGAFNVRGDVDEHSPAFEGLRRAGFIVYAWQRIWKLPEPDSSNRVKSAQWQPAASGDELSIRNLYQALVPPLVQSAEPLPEHRIQGLVYRQQGEVHAYVETIYGPSGIYILPLIHPDVNNVIELLNNLPNNLLSRIKRPVYLAVRSYQGWLDAPLEELKWQAAPRQALMVKHLAVGQRVLQTNHLRVVLEGRQVEPTAPMVNNIVGNHKHIVIK